MYHDAISQESTAQLLQEIDGLGSDGQAVFICAATNPVDYVDCAMLSRFAERIEIPLPDEPARRALLGVFLGTMRFAGDRQIVIETLAKSSVGRSGRDLRNLVNAAVLEAVKRTSSPKDFALTAKDLLSKTRVTPAATVAPSAPASFQLDPTVREDSIAALMALGFKRKEAQSRVDAVATGSTAEEIIKVALQSTVNCPKGL
jgi:SpoVK/Ycf46/Vps4 family AAA+-type ATPase